MPTLHVDLFDSTVQDHPLFEEGILEGASWEGPANEWPKASTVLLDFAEPLRVAEISTQQAQEALHFAAMVWSTVVLADHAGQEALLETTLDILGAGEHGQILHHLIQRKRALYPQDNRIMQVESLTRSKGRMDLRVTWTEAN